MTAWNRETRSARITCRWGKNRVKLPPCGRANQLLGNYSRSWLRRRGFALTDWPAGTQTGDRHHGNCSDQNSLHV